MTKLNVGDKELELVLNEDATAKAEAMNVKEGEIATIISNNQKALVKSVEEEEVMIIGRITITFFRKDEKVVVTNLFSQQSVL